jgi:hypothetical protein
MKKFLFRVLLPVLIILSVLFIGGECYLRSLPNDFKTKNQYLEDNAKNIKIMVLGASAVSMGIKPCYFDLQLAYNFAQNSQRPEQNYWILNKRFDEMDSLKYVIMDMSSGQPWISGKPEGRNLDKFYVLYYDYPRESSEFEMLSSVQEIYHRIRPSNAKEAYQTIDDDGCQSKYYEDLPYDEEKWQKSVEWSLDHYAKLIHSEKSAMKYKNSVDYMCKIISKCGEKNVKVIMVTPPAMSMWYEKMEKEQLETMYHVADSLSSVFDNVVYWDFFRADSLFTVDEFYNPTHLNPRGAKKFTMMLNDSINKIEQRQ